MEEEDARTVVEERCREALENQQQYLERRTQAVIAPLKQQLATLECDLADLKSTHETLQEHWQGLQQNLQNSVNEFANKLALAKNELDQRRQEADNSLDSRVEALRQAGSKDQLNVFKKIIKVCWTLGLGRMCISCIIAAAILKDLFTLMHLPCLPLPFYAVPTGGHQAHVGGLPSHHSLAALEPRT